MALGFAVCDTALPLCAVPLCAGCGPVFFLCWQPTRATAAAKATEYLMGRKLTLRNLAVDRFLTSGTAPDPPAGPIVECRAISRACVQRLRFQIRCQWLGPGAGPGARRLPTSLLPPVSSANAHRDRTAARKRGSVSIEQTYRPPVPERREWLLDELATLCAKRGFETLVYAPTLEPSSEYFPDEWTPTVGGVRRLIARLMAYADLADVEVDLRVFDSRERPDPDDDEDYVPQHQGVVAWYAGNRDGVARFGLDLRKAADPVGLTGVLCHEVAHAYREHHALGVADRKLEEQLTDLTTVFLGFGFFTASAAFVSSSRGSLRGGWVYTQFSVSRGGYLPAGEVAFLLAARAIARGDGKKSVAHLRGELPANQSHALKLSWKLLAGDPAALRARLGVPDDWPPDREMVPVELAIEARAGDDRKLESTPARTPADTRRPTFRVPRSHTTLLGFVGASLGLIVAVTVFDEWQTSALAFIAGGVLTGVAFGRAWRGDYCAYAECGERLRPDDTHCPGCHRLVAGRIAHASERLEAEEAWEERQRLEPGTPYRSEARPEE